MSTHFLALDCGAESGRVMLGTLSPCSTDGVGGRLTLEEIHRFPTGAVRIAGSPRWDVLRIADELRHGVRLAAARGVRIASLSSDTWGVDYVLTRKGEPLLTLPRHYRDPRNLPAYDKTRAQLGEELIFAETGIQFMAINTLYQLVAAHDSDPALLASADRLVPMGDWFNFVFSGVAVGDASMASTTQLYNPRTRTWSATLIERLGLPRHLFPQIVPCGTVIGPVTAEFAAETGLAPTTRVIASCSHDTGAAVAGIPAEGDGWAYLSSGTWSLLGVEHHEPVITAKSRAHNFTNEVGVGHSIRLLKNISGLWVVQECRRSWEAAGTSYDYAALTTLAEAAAPLRSLINPNDPRFVTADGMPDKIAAYCRETGQPVPQSPGEFVRCALESLALSYRRTLAELEDTTGRALTRLHIVGGGTKNLLLNQLAADATGRTVLAGPVEATAAGNVLIQAMALGQLADLAAIRRVVRSSFPITTYQPRDAATWDAAYNRFKDLP
jgi:rhamnulokinase